MNLDHIGSVFLIAASASQKAIIALLFLIAAVSLSTAIIWALSFLQIKEFLNHIGCAVFFNNSRILICIGSLSFSRLEAEYWRSPFFNHFSWSDF